MSVTISAPTSRVVSENYNAAWQSKNSITDTVILRKLHENFGEGYRMVDFKRMAGDITYVNSKGITHIEQDAPLRAVKTGSAITVGADGASISFTLHADNLDVNSKHVLRKNFDIIIPASFQPTGVKDDRKYLVTDITGTTVTAVPWNKSGTYLTASKISTQIDSGTWLAIGASAFAPGTDQPEGTTDSYTTQSHTSRIMKETIKVEGGQVAQPYYPATGLDQNKGLISKGSVRAEFLLENQMEQFIRDGEPNDTDSLTGTSYFGGTNNIKGGKGVITWLQELAQKYYYTSPSVDDFYDIKLLQESQGIVATVNDYFVGPDLMIGYEKAELDFIKEFSGGTNLYNEVMGKTGIVLKAFEFGGKTYVLHALDSLKNPAQAGLNINGDYTYSYPSMGFVIPREKVTAYMFDGKPNQTIPNFSLGLVNMNGEDRSMMYGIMPGMNGFEQGNIVANGYDGVSYFWASECMCIMGGVNKMVLVRKSK